jgi:CRP-like cAMP-binding protein
MVFEKSVRLKRRRSSLLVPQVRSHGVTHDEQETKNIEADADFYWREWLEKQINSLPVNIFVLVTVTCDIFIAIFFLTRDNEVVGGALSPTLLLAEPEKMFQLVWNGLVNLIFVGEITLRQMAMSGRFWSNSLNIFDFCVVWLSVLGQVGYYVLEYWSVPSDQNLTNTLASAGLSRIISRIVIIARFIRVVNTLRKARNVSGQMNYAIRSVVSQNKRRLQWNGFDLDLTYITNRIVAMSVPAFGKATAYRNNIHQVSRYLALKHYGRFFIFNLCDTFDSSDGIMGQYHPSMLYNAVQRVPFEDHSPPLMSEMLYFCQEAAAWMAAHPQNIVCVHCKGGKGRTGVMIAALMMWTGHRRCALDALELFTFRRTSNYDPAKSLDGADDGADAEGGVDTGENGKASGCSKFLKRLLCCGCFQSSKSNQGVEGPSQIRYVHYLQAVLYNGVDPWSNEPRFVSSIEFPSCTFRGRRVWYMSFTVRCQRIQFYDSFARNGSAVTISSSGHSSVSLPVRMNLTGDVRIDFFVHTHVAKPNRKLECFVTFNTCFCKGRDLLVFKKRNIDMFHKDRKHNKVPADFELAVNLEPRTSESLDSRFHTLFANAGQSITLRKGDKLLDKERFGDSLYLIESGYVEGVVEEETEEVHALGSCLPHVVAEHRTCSNAQDTQQMTNNSTKQRRTPIMCILGKGSVIGASQFLTKKRSMLFRVRSSEARVLRILSTSHDDRPESTEFSVTQTPSSNPRTPMLSRVRSMMTMNLRRMFSPTSFSATFGGRSSGVDIQSLVDGVTDEDDGTRHRIQGIGVQDLGVFYHGFAQALVPLLDRAQVSCIYIKFRC